MIKHMPPIFRPSFITAAAAALALVAAGCGSSSKSSSSSKQATTQTSSRTQSAGPAPAVDELAAAEHPSADQFPSARGRSLQQLANLARPGPQLGPATGVFTPGTGREAFGLNTSSGAFIYAPTAIYLARSPNAPAQGPFLAPADPMGVAAAYRSQQNAGPGGIQAIYAADVPLPRTGTYAVLALTRVGNTLLGSTGEIAVAATSSIPAVGEKPPSVATDTAATVHGNASLLTTRVPPETGMQAVSFSEVLGKRPIALLFSTPQLCQSKVCGPVTDIAAQLANEFGSRVAFIHEEVYVNNQPQQGLRPQLKAFHLQTEPWLFTVNSRGVIVSRLEGAFGVTEFRQAVEAALR
jgi:hypothetical protein